MAKQGIPVVLVENGTPAILGNKGMPITIVGGHGGAGEVVDQQVVPVTNSAGGDAHDANAAVSNGQLTGLELQSATASFIDNGDTVTLSGPDSSRNFGSVTANVSSGVVQRVNLPTGSSVITNQAGAINVSDADGTVVNCTATIVDQTGELSFVGVPGTAALVTNNLSVKMANFGGAGPVDGVMQITGGFINWVSLANQTDAIISNTFSTGVSFAVSPSDDFGTVNVSSGALQSVTVSLAPTKTIVENSQQLTGVAPTGTYTNTVTFTVANGVITGIALS